MRKAHSRPPTLPVGRSAAVSKPTRRDVGPNRGAGNGPVSAQGASYPSPGRSPGNPAAHDALALKGQPNATFQAAAGWPGAIPGLRPRHRHGASTPPHRLVWLWAWEYGARAHRTAAGAAALPISAHGLVSVWATASPVPARAGSARALWLTGLGGGRNGNLSYSNCPTGSCSRGPPPPGRSPRH